MDERPSSYEALVSSLEQGSAPFEGMHDLLKIAPYARYVLAAYNWAKRRRIVRFLRALGRTIDDLSPSQRDTLNRVIKSETGGEILADYVDSVVRTSSSLANVALAILYADVETNVFPKEFKYPACLALDGISDRLVNYFLSVLEIRRVGRRADDADPHPVYFLDMETASKIDGLGPAEVAPSEHILYMHELIRRGLFLPDPRRTRLEGKEWSIPFGVGESTTRFEGLLKRARRFLAEEWEG